MSTSSRSVPARCVRRAAVLGTILLAITTTAAAAQQQPSLLRVGQPATGTLRDGDPLMVSGMGPFHVYRLDAREGDRLVLTLRSGAFDAFLGIMRAVGGIHEVVATDDDGGGGSDARLRWTVPATDSYLVVAQAFEREGRGGYTLLVETAKPSRPITALPIRIGETKQGTITDESALVENEDDVFHDLHVFDARAGQELVITLDSDDFDAFLAVGHLRGTAIEVIATDDDSGGDANARLRLTIPQDGRYGIHARGLGPDAFGRYTLSIRESPLPAPKPLARGREVQATLSADGIDQWLVQGRAGERVRVRMRSDDFDTVLVIGRLDGSRFEPLAENDDAEDEGTTDSLLDFSLPADGQYVVRASAFTGSGTGRYTIRLDSAVPSGSRTSTL